jgi:phosphohistidine phosphatase
MRLYLVRHGAAEEPGSRPDRERRLVERGRQDARRVGAGLRSLGVRPRLLSSPLARARETSVLIAAELSVVVEVRDALASGASPDDFLRELRAAGGEELLLVGHQPDLGVFASILLSGSPVGGLSFRPASVCCLDLEGEVGRLAWIRNPEEFEPSGPGSV